VVAVAAGTAVMAVAAFVTVLAWPATTDPDRPLAFHGLQWVGAVELGDDLDPTGKLTQVHDGSIYVAGQQGDQLMVTAAILSSGEPRWQQPLRDLTGLETLRGLTVVDDAVVLFGDPYPSGEAAVVVLNAGTGAQRWRRTHHDGDGWYTEGDLLTLADRQQHRLRGLDLASGREAWGVPFPGQENAAVIGVTVDQDLAGPSPLWSNYPVRHDHRLVLVGADRSARVLDARDGEVITQHTNVAAPGDWIETDGDRLFVAGTAGGYQLFSYDLANLSATPRVLYTAADSQRSLAAWSRCGEDRMCLLESGSDPAEVVAVDVGAAGERWRQDAGGAERLLPAGSALVAVGGDPGTVGLDRDGGRLFERPGRVARINAGNLLFFTPGSGWDVATADLGVAGYAVADRTFTELGQVRGVWAPGCSWDTRHLVCPTGQGAEIWRFAGD
jgi:hypothetical protein